MTRSDISGDKENLPKNLTNRTLAERWCCELHASVEDPVYRKRPSADDRQSPVSMDHFHRPLVLDSK